MNERHALMCNLDDDSSAVDDREWTKWIDFGTL